MGRSFTVWPKTALTGSGGAYPAPQRSYIKIRDLIRSGAIGRLKTVRMTQNHHALDWERYRRLLEDCSPILDCGVHYFDVLQWFTGSAITEVMGMGAVVDADLEPGRYNYGS